MRTLSGIIARADGSMVRGRLTFDDTISSLEPSASAGDDYILPGLIDLQVNGSHGISVMRASAEELSTISERLLREGTTGWLPTAVTSPIERIERVDRAVSEAQAAPDRGHPRAAILGMHLEGPFISPRRLGAHPAANREPRGELIEQVLRLGSLRLLTLAPELEGATETIRRLTARGVVVSIGHTDATLEQARTGVAAGARMFTHLFDAMRPLNHRDPGVIAAGLIDEEALAAVIPDGVHVDAEMLRLVFRLRGAGGMILTTDKVALAGLADGTLTLPGRRARVEGGAARLTDGRLVGSVISMLDGVRLMVEKVGATVGEAARMASANPAHLMGLTDRGRLEEGARADLIVLTPALELKTVYCAGREVR